MSAPRIPGLSRYPEMEKKFIRRYAEASRASCSKCARRRLIQATRQQLEVRLRRDNPRRKS